MTNYSTSSHANFDSVLWNWRAFEAKRKAQQEADDLRIFVFDGTIDEFKDECRRQGVHVRDDSILSGQTSIFIDPGFPIPFPDAYRLGSLEVQVLPGKVIAGTRKAINRFLGAEPMPEAKPQSPWTLGGGV